MKDIIINVVADYVEANLHPILCVNVNEYFNRINIGISLIDYSHVGTIRFYSGDKLLMISTNITNKHHISEDLGWYNPERMFEASLNDPDLFAVLDLWMNSFLV